MGEPRKFRMTAERDQLRDITVIITLQVRDIPEALKIVETGLPDVCIRSVYEEKD